MSISPSPHMPPLPISFKYPFAPKCPFALVLIFPSAHFPIHSPHTFPHFPQPIFTHSTPPLTPPTFNPYPSHTPPHFSQHFPTPPIFTPHFPTPPPTFSHISLNTFPTSPKLFLTLPQSAHFPKCPLAPVPTCPQCPFL